MATYYVFVLFLGVGLLGFYAWQSLDRKKTWFWTGNAGLALTVLSLAMALWG